MGNGKRAPYPSQPVFLQHKTCGKAGNTSTGHAKRPSENISFCEVNVFRRPLFKNIRYPAIAAKTASAAATVSSISSDVCAAETKPAS